jgi:hypothetical protein
MMRRSFKKATKKATQIVTHADDGTTPITTRAIIRITTGETLGAAS